MALYVQVKDNTVVQCIDTTPPSPIGTDGWKNAVEVRPTINFDRQMYTAHVFDISKDPVEIVYGTQDFTLEERKNQLISRATFPVMQLTMQKRMAEMTNQSFDESTLTAAQATADALVAQIEAATTHDQLDAIQI